MKNMTLKAIAGACGGTLCMGRRQDSPQDGEREATLLSPREVVYCESVDERTFVYTSGAVFQTALSLAELEDWYGGLGLFRAGKSAVVNLHHIRTLKSRPGGRIEAALETGEKLMVSRHYAPLLRERLGL